MLLLVLGEKGQVEDMAAKCWRASMRVAKQYSIVHRVQESLQLVHTEVVDGSYSLCRLQNLTRPSNSLRLSFAVCLPFSSEL